MRLLHAGHAADGAGAARAQARIPIRRPIREAIGGNYCRCTGYHAIVQAVLRRGAEPIGEGAAGAGGVRRPPPENGGYIGRSVVRPQTARLVAGRGTYTDDVAIPRLLHAAFVRSPHAHARIAGIDTAEAAALPGVVAVVTGREMAARCEPWVGVLKNYAGMKSAPQYPLALDKAVWQGEPVVAVVAESRALAEDGCARVRVTWEPLPPVVDAEAALAPGATLIHPELGDNLVLETRDEVRRRGRGVQAPPTRSTGTPSTPAATRWSASSRGWCWPTTTAADETLTVYHSGQAPYMLHDILSRHLRIPEHRVRVINKDVGGSFGLKIHTYPDEIATCALAVMLGRPVKFLADRIESFQTDIHSRDHRVTAEVAVKRDGTILAMRLDDLAPVGPLLDVSALERRRERPGPAHHARPLPLPRLRGARPRGVPEQDADVPVPRGRPPRRRARHGGDGRPRRPRARRSIP